MIESDSDGDLDLDHATHSTNHRDCDSDAEKSNDDDDTGQPEDKVDCGSASNVESGSHLEVCHLSSLSFQFINFIIIHHWNVILISL